MPSKSRHSKAKRLSLDKRRREIQRSSATTTPQPMAAQTSEPTHPGGKVAPKASVPTPSPKSVAVHYPYIGAELLRISILSGIILVILIVLALVLPKL